MKSIPQGIRIGRNGMVSLSQITVIADQEVSRRLTSDMLNTIPAFRWIKNMQSGSQFTVLLKSWRGGDPKAADQVMELAFTELRQLAGRFLRAERQDHTLSATALVNEMYLRLAGSEPIDWQDRAHFFAIAAKQLRRILVNYARDRQAQKRGGRQVKLSLTEVNQAAQPQDQDLLALNAALIELAELDVRASAVVELRYFAGLTEAETAEALGISVATVKRDWNWARAWLIANLER